VSNSLCVFVSISEYIILLVKNQQLLLIIVQ
jgi:hypothetical protein